MLKVSEGQRLRKAGPVLAEIGTNQLRGFRQIKVNTDRTKAKAWVNGSRDLVAAKAQMCQ